MPSASLATTSHTEHRNASSAAHASGPTEQALARALHEVHAVVPPLWPLADYVAVNPCLGLVDQSLLGAHLTLSRLRDCQLLLPREYFQALYRDGRISPADLKAAIEQCAAEHPGWFAAPEIDHLVEWLIHSSPTGTETNCRYRTVAEAVDQQHQSTWSSHIINDITRHCAAHFDEGQALWKSPWKGETLYSAWQESAQLSRRMDLLGIKGFRAFVASLPASPRQAIHELLWMLNVPSSRTRSFLLTEIFSVAGWASYVRFRVREAEAAGQENEDLIGLLAIRLAYDAALARAPGINWPLPLWPAATLPDDGLAGGPAPSTDVLARYTLQVAAEHAYRRALLQKLASHPVTPRRQARKKLQIVFCIDVRSEVMRRNLESVDAEIETFGFAGFFGMPLEYVPLGFSQGTAQCPVLLEPGFQVHESLLGSDESTTREIVRKRMEIRQGRKLWKAFQTSAVSCFSFVESLGLPYLGKLLTDSMQWTRPASPADLDGLSRQQASLLGPDVCAGHNRGLDLNRRIDLAEGMLRNLGLVAGFARVVALCGHASDVTNNPYRAALDCGACGGHSGEPNARVAAALLNDPQVRHALAGRGIHIPSDTVFIAAVHNTTTDEIRLLDAHLGPPSHGDDLVEIGRWLDEAARLSRLERSPRLGTRNAADVLRRSRDWAEVRPEWGLAGNAAFIVASRSRTAGLNLGGRTFMHSYDHQLDPERKVLELIMTAPMVVTNWINMQYYASAVDPIAFGSGNKVIHNVVGQFGVLQGNGGDLMTGLPWQSIHDGHRLQHEPLRLLVLIEAPRTALRQVIEKHQLVRNLVTNGWVTLVAWDDDEFYRWTHHETWEAQSVDTCL